MILWEDHSIHGIKEGCGSCEAGGYIRLQLGMYTFIGECYCIDVRVGYVTNQLDQEGY